MAATRIGWRPLSFSRSLSDAGFLARCLRGLIARTYRRRRLPWLASPVGRLLSGSPLIIVNRLHYQRGVLPSFLASARILSAYQAGMVMGMASGLGMRAALWVGWGSQGVLACALRKPMLPLI
jgi:hypothetical protein